MKRIRTKLVLSFLVITLLPVFPVYYLVKSLLQRSLGIGFNKNVEMALEKATDFSRELYATYKSQTADFARELAASNWTHSLIDRGISAAVLSEKVKAIGRGKIDFFDATGKLLYTGSNYPEHAFPEIYQTTFRPLLKKQETEILTISDDLGHVSAFAPIDRNGVRLGFLVVTKAIEEEISRGSQRVVDVHQMFKTLDFFEDDLTRGFLLSFIVIYIPIAGLSVGLGYYFSRKITTPLLSLVKGTKKVATGDWEHRVKVTSKDEVGQLVAAFNNMVCTLKDKQDQVIALEKMAVWREIARILAHEIKNPLTPIQLTVQHMKDKYTGTDPEYGRLLAECSEIVTEEIESLRTLVKEFSDFARMPKLNPTLGDLNDLVREVRKLYSDSPLQVELDSTLPEFTFDYEKMRRVLINLIENSLDGLQDRKDQELIVRTSIEDGAAVLFTRDNGCGIPPDVKEKIFEPYFSTKKTGVGLGLAIVKRIVEEHGGRIALESTEGEGTEFCIRLPF